MSSKGNAELNRILEKYQGILITKEVLDASRSTKELSYLVGQIDDLIALCRTVGKIKPEFLERLNQEYRTKIIADCIRSALLIGVESKKVANTLDSERLQLLKTALAPLYSLGELLWKGSFREEKYSETDLEKRIKDWSALVTASFLILTARAGEIADALPEGHTPQEGLAQLKVRADKFLEA